MSISKKTVHKLHSTGKDYATGEKVYGFKCTSGAVTTAKNWTRDKKQVTCKRCIAGNGLGDS